MEAMNMQNLITLMKLWENVFVQKFVVRNSLSNMKPARADNKKPEGRRLMALWENALAQKFFVQKSAVKI